MSKRKGTYDPQAQILIPVGYIPEAGPAGDIAIDVSVNRSIELDITGTSVSMNASEAEKLGRALIKAAHLLGDGK